MKLVEPITGGIVENDDDEAIKRLTSRGFVPYLPDKPKPKQAARKRQPKKEQ